VYKNIKLTPGAVPFVSELQKQGYKIGVLSGGFNAITQRVAADLGLDFAFANDLEVVDGKLTGEVIAPTVCVLIALTVCMLIWWLTGGRPNCKS
jgi:phosphoserine phosphatase